MVFIPRHKAPSPMRSTYWLRALILALLCICLLQTGCRDTAEKSTGEQTAEITTTYAEVDIQPHSNDTTSASIFDDPINKKLYDDTMDFISYNTWYCYFEDEYKKLYELDFKPSLGQMEWRYGYVESEYENRFTGSFAVNDDGSFHAELYDERYDEFYEDWREVRIDITFELYVINKDEISFTITSSSLEKYKHLENQPITFKRD